MSEGDTERAALIYKARIAEQAERWGDMAKAMAERTETEGAYTLQEAQLMATAFKNVVAPIRIQWKLAHQARAKYIARGLEARANMADQAAKGAAEEVKALCKQTVNLMQKLRPADAETAALFAKMAADYARYEAEITGASAEAVGSAYERAAAACSQLPPHSAVKLGTALNYAVFTHDVKQQSAAAVAIADAAVQALGNVEPVDRNAHLASALLKSNISLWQAESASA